MKQILVPILLVLLSASALANDRAIRSMAQANHGFTEKEIRAEIKKGCDGTGNMALCAWYRYHIKDVQLNDTYSELMRRIESPNSKEELRKSQRAWLEFRGSECIFATGGWEGGSFRRVAIAGCWEVMTDAREKDLAGILRCGEQDCIPLKEESTPKPVQ
jgi:uncharacterized protein YecT (DUF1311 family)